MMARPSRAACVSSSAWLASDRAMAPGASSAASDLHRAPKFSGGLGNQASSV
ncbi:MAG TPA: hypothetical protein VKP60_13215 [Magnetospirillaceae bacterium]|nr:hypothetical protein [Magnetospirillaceae bacterium]